MASRFRAPGSRLGRWRETVVTDCNEGLHAALPWCVLSKLLGDPDVRVYDNSMAEWTTNHRWKRAMNWWWNRN